MKKYLFYLALIFSIPSLAQTGIGTSTPDQSAKLDVQATNKGFLPPRISLASAYDQSTIPNPATGLLVYCKGDAGLSAGYYYWNGSAWATIATAGGSGSVAAEFGSKFLNSLGVSTVSVSSATPVTVLSFQLPSAGTWEVSSILRAQGSAGFAAEYALYDAGGSVVTNSEVIANYGATAATGTGMVLITTTGAATYTLKAFASSGSYSVYDDFNGRTGVVWRKISGNAPVTGQSVDYGIARYTGADTGPLTTGAVVPLDAGAVGNLAWSGNKFTLKANKTYELESYLAIYQSAGGVAGIFQIYDFTNNTSLANGLYMSINGGGTNNPSGNGPMRAIVTPTADIQVGIRLASYYGTAAAPGLIGNASYLSNNAAANQCYLMAKQLGSSAFVNPWVLNGSDVYNTSGKVGIGTSAPGYTLDVSGTARISTTPTITTATNVLVKDPTTSQLSEQPISFVTGIAKFILNTSQAVSNGQTIVLNTTSNNTISSYVSLNTSTGVITLQPGTYELNGSAGALNASAGSNGDSRVYSMFHNGTTYVGSGGVSETGPAGNWNGMPQNNANYVITVPVGQTAQIAFKALVANNVASLSGLGDFGANGDAGRAWVVVRKYN